MLQRIGRQQFSQSMQATLEGPVSRSPLDTDGFELPPWPATAHLRPAEDVSGSQTRIIHLPSAPTAGAPHDSKQLRRRAGNVQINQAHKEYRDTWGAQLLAARPSMIDDGCARKASRMAENAGRELVTLRPEGLVSMGITSDLAQAKTIVKTLRKAGVLDAHNQISRGPERDVDNSELSRAILGLHLAHHQELALRDVVVVLKFLYDFGIREAESLFDLTVCCGANTYARPSTWTEWGSTLAHLFDVNANDDHRVHLKAQRAALSAEIQRAE